MGRKPQTASGYSKEESEQVKATCLTVAAILGDLMDDICVVGGIVPAMICEAEMDPAALDDGAHCGTTDLDVGLSLGLLDEERYKEIAARLRARGFRPDENEDGNKTRQRWRWHDLKVTVDFLIPPPTDAPGREARLKSLERDFAALVVRPLHLAFDERVTLRLEGHNLLGDAVERDIHFAGPAAMVAMKAFAYHLRWEPKDAYDLVFILSHWGEGMADIAKRMARHTERWPQIVADALGFLRSDFGQRESPGPRDVSRFLTGGLDDDQVADAHGAVADLLAACQRAEVGGKREGPAPAPG